MGATNLLLAIPAAYKSAVLALMISEANVAVEKLSLPEVKPITEQKLAMAFVSPPIINKQNGLLGTIETKKFGFSFAAGNKLTSLGRIDLLCHGHLSRQELTDAYEKLAIPPSKVDTNAAWQAILPYLHGGFLDVDRLNRECELELTHLQWGKLHVPKYYARWTRGGKDIAGITILMPDKVLLSLRIEDPSFNMRPGFQLTNSAAQADTPSR